MSVASTGQSDSSDTARRSHRDKTHRDKSPYNRCKAHRDKSPYTFPSIKSYLLRLMLVNYVPLYLILTGSTGTTSTCKLKAVLLLVFVVLGPHAQSFRAEPWWISKPLTGHIKSYLLRLTWETVYVRSPIMSSVVPRFKLS